MQTTLQFGNTSTIQEWSNFKGILKGAGKQNTLVKSPGGPGSLIDHLTKQLQGASVIKKWDLKTESFEGAFTKR